MTQISTSSNKKSGQRYQNTFAFQPNKNSKKTKLINSLPINGLCHRCKEIVEWRKKYKKYKPLTTPKRCVSCNEKTVKEAYHILCNKCATDKKVCAKCQESVEIVSSNIKSNKELLKEQQAQEKLLSSLPERKRRTYLRQLERGEAPLSSLVKDLDDDDGFDDFSDKEELA
ncbi:8534_t:CDS:2 [Funneliformis mosseae]|uniref:8534_t:CDS:1 n=1 Tax=Funneliformis mosseae TaxID=27381 RepID=A0A9N9FY74_FUNMO|nr:8534_t:CDS:2 [Funneliformis mosseae]